MKKPSNQHSFSVLYLNLVLIFGAVASAHAEASHTPSSQAADENPCSHESRNTGALIGGLVGLGLSIFGKGDTETKAIATVVGAGVGGLIGNEMDVRRCELERIYVMGAGMMPEQKDAKSKNVQYRDPKTLAALKQFWEGYFSRSNAKLEEFGAPELLSPIQW